MSEPSAHIRDHQSLIELNNTLEYSADSILKILEQVDAYLKGVIEALKQQMKVLEEELRAAEKALEEAEKAHNSCLASQRWVEEYEDEDGNTHGGYYTPSCNSEASEVERCREERDRCQEKYEKAKRICDDCEYEIEQYKYPGGIFYIPPPGGEKTMEDLAKEHTDKATSKMRDILAVVEKYLRYNMSTKASCFSTTPTDIDVANGSSKTLSPEEKKERFNNAIQKVIERQQNENYGSRQIADANRVIRCPRCGRPPIACICNNTREREYTREDIQIIRNDFSR